MTGNPLTSAICSNMAPSKPYLVAFVVLSLGCGSQGKPATPIADLLQALKSDNEAARIVAAEDLGEPSQADVKQAVSALTEAVKDKSPYVRAAAIRSLAKIGPEARPAVPAIQKALKDPDDGVRLAAEKALKEISGS
jgi:HEAT repeat protein